MIESTRAAWGASAVDRCKISQDHGPGVASDLLRGGLGGPSLGLDVLEDCAPSAALLLLVGGCAQEWNEVFDIRWNNIAIWLINRNHGSDGIDAV